MSIKCVLLMLLIMLVSAVLTPVHALDVLILKSADIQPYNDAEKGFLSEVKSGVRTIIVDTAANADSLAGVRKHLNHSVDLLYVIGERALYQSSMYVSDVPMVFSYVFHHERFNKLMANNQKVMGVSMMIPPEEQLRGINELVPELRRIGIVYDAMKSQQLVDRAKVYSRQLGMTVVDMAVDSPANIVIAVESLAGKVDAIMLLPDTTVVTSATVRYLLLFGYRNKIPVIGLSEKHVKDGALLGLSLNSLAIGEQAGRLALKLLGGEIASDRRVDEPEKLNTIFNSNTAKKLNLRLRDDYMEKVDIEYQ